MQVPIASGVVIATAAPRENVQPQGVVGGFFESLRLIGDAAVSQAKSIDNTYKISDKIVEVATPGIALFSESIFLLLFGLVALHRSYYWQPLAHSTTPVISFLDS